MPPSVVFNNYSNFQLNIIELMKASKCIEVTASATWWPNVSFVSLKFDMQVRKTKKVVWLVHDDWIHVAQYHNIRHQRSILKGSQRFIIKILWKFSSFNHYSKDLFRPQSCTCHSSSGPRLNIKTVLSMYGDFHVKDKTVVRTSYL